MNLSQNSSFYEDMKILDEIVLYLNLISTAIGTINNLISVTIFFQRTLLNRKFNWYLLVLTIFDLLFCLTVFIDNIFVKINKRGIFLHELHKICFIIIDFTIHTTDSCSSILTLLLSLDRLYAIISPLKIKQFITNLHAKKLMMISLAIVISLRSIDFSLCEIYSDSKPFIVFCSLVSPILINGIPLLVIAFLNGILAVKIWNYNSNTNRSDSLNSGISIKNHSSAHMNPVVGNLSNNSNSNGVRFSLPLTSRRKNLDVNKFKVRSNVGSSNRKKDSIGISDVQSSKRNTLLDETSESRKFSGLKNTKKQKSHYIVILVLSIWSMITSCPYYFLKTYYSLFQLNYISNNFNVQIFIKAHVISSIFFNLNHCLLFFVYSIFYTEFRNILCLKKEKRFQNFSASQSVNRNNSVKFNESIL
jgi:hypothetical protein